LRTPRRQDCGQRRRADVKAAGGTREAGRGEEVPSDEDAAAGGTLRPQTTMAALEQLTTRMTSAVSLVAQKASARADTAARLRGPQLVEELSRICDHWIDDLTNLIGQVQGKGAGSSVGGSAWETLEARMAEQLAQLETTRNNLRSLGAEAGTRRLSSEISRLLTAAEKLRVSAIEVGEGGG